MLIQHQTSSILLTNESDSELNLKFFQTISINSILTSQFIVSFKMVLKAKRPLTLKQKISVTAFNVEMEDLLPIDTKSLSSRTSLMRSSGSQMAPPTVLRMSCTTSCRLGTKDGGFSFKYRRRASSPSHLILFLPANEK